MLASKFSKLILFIALVVFAFSCIDEFMPELDETSSLLVIDGSVIKGDSLQKVTITRSTSVNNPEYIAVSGCDVQVIDSSGNVFQFEDHRNGNYTCAIPEQDLRYGEAYKLRVVTESGKTYESAWEEINISSPIDSLYFTNEPNQTANTTSDLGLQFYTDLSAPEGYSRYYRWLLTETYEYHSDFTLDAYFDFSEDTIFYPEDPDTIRICYKTDPVGGFYSSSTENLTENRKKRITLSYVPRESKKLNVAYSLLVRQYALTEEAYKYWDKNKVETSESGGLYQKQPSQSLSNYRNINDPDEVVLGYFWASSYSEKRIFYEGPLVTTYNPYPCAGDTIKLEDAMLSYKDLFISIIGITQSEDPIWGVAEEPCFDCRRKGGEFEKPDYWDEFFD